MILTNDELISQLSQITVAQITTTIRGVDSEVLLDESDGMPEECVINFVNLKTVEKRKINKVITHLSSERMREVREAIEFVFNINNL